MNFVPIFPDASRLGFGCASLGSRVGKAQGLRSLAVAFERGVNWFDLAPSYGDGMAESIFGTFAAGRRDRVHICTKVGIAPPRLGLAKRLARPAARGIVGLAPALRTSIAGRRHPVVLPLSAEVIRDSLDRSLRAMKTEYVDVLALHDPDPTSATREDVLRALESAVEAGKARVVGVAGGCEAASEASGTRGLYRHLQFSVEDMRRAGQRLIAKVAESGPASLALHSVLASENFSVGVDECAHQAFARRLRDHGYTGPFDKATRAAVLDFALATAGPGVVLVSMFKPAHIAENFEILEGTKARAENAFAMFSVLKGKRA